MRIVALDTETTGLELSEGNRVIEIGCVEIVNRRLTGHEFRRLVNPGRENEAKAFEIHGISDEELQDKPPFADVESEFIEFIAGAELIVHNAAFDVAFLDHELSLTSSALTSLESVCSITDTWQIAKNRHPGQRNNIDALCKRYDIDASAREKHGALLDAQLLAQVYLAMTGGQISLMLGEESSGSSERQAKVRRKAADSRAALARHKPTAEEISAHETLLNKIDGLSENGCLWLKKDAAKPPH